MSTVAAVTLELAISGTKLEPESALVVRNEFHPFFALATEWVEKVDAVTDPKVARDSRLALKKIRCDAENVRKRMKSEVIAYGNAIESCYKVIAGVTEPLEAKLEGIEKAAALAEQARLAAIQKERGDALKVYLPAVNLIGLELMPEEEYQKLLASVKAAREAQIEKDKQAEEQRKVQAEKDRLFAENLKRVQDEENARITAENARLKAERDANDRLMAEMKEKAELERQRLAAEIKKNADRIAAERKAEDARIANERAMLAAEAEKVRLASVELARQEKDRLAKIARDKQLAEEAARKAASAPDREKLFKLAEYLTNCPDPEVTSEAGKAASEEICEQLSELITFIELKAGLL